MQWRAGLLFVSGFLLGGACLGFYFQRSAKGAAAPAPVAPQMVAQARRATMPPDDATEESWMLQEVLRHLAALCHYASHPDQSEGPPVVVEMRQLDKGNEQRLTYLIRVGDQEQRLILHGAIWDPLNYKGLTQQWLTHSAEAGSAHQQILEELLDPSLANLLLATTMTSVRLTEHAADPSAHVDAALLLGAMAWTEFSGRFQDTRPLLNRMTAHLAFADCLQPEPSLSRKVAEMLRLTLLNNRRDALRLADEMSTQNPDAVISTWLQVVRLRCTEDWRETEKTVVAATPLLQQEHFRAVRRALGVNRAQALLSVLRPQNSLPFYRIACDGPLSVGQGHNFVNNLTALEFQEVERVPRTLVDGDRQAGNLPNFFSVSGPDRVVKSIGGKAWMLAADEALWSGYLQRRLCHSLVVNYDFSSDLLGDEETAGQIVQYSKIASSWRFYPFLKLMLHPEKGRQEHVEALVRCYEVAHEHPEWLTAGLWGQLGSEPEPGTAEEMKVRRLKWLPSRVPRFTAYYDENGRTQEFTDDRADTDSWLEELLILAPTDTAILQQFCRLQGSRPEVIRQRFGPLLATHVQPLIWIGEMEKDPAAMEKALVETAALDPDNYMRLAFLLQDKAPEKAEIYWLKAYELATDRVWFANGSRFLVERLYQKKDFTKAEKVALAAGHTGSQKGMGTLGWLQEQLKKWPEAAATYRSIDDRYFKRVPTELVGFWLRRQRSGEGFDAEACAQAIHLVFPSGFQNAKLSDFSGTPKAGTVFKQGSLKLAQYGLDKGFVVVAVDGIRVENFAQYQAVREATKEDRMKLIVWNGTAYQEIFTTAPGRLFGVDMDNYPSAPSTEPKSESSDQRQTRFRSTGFEVLGAVR